MQKQATFYLLESSDKLTNHADIELSNMEILACNIIADLWRLKNRILVSCDNLLQAENIDEALWQFDIEQFVPHGLSSETNINKSPIEICWPEKRSLINRDYLVSLNQHIPDISVNYRNIIDFVPEQEDLKQLARERYKKYKQLGFIVNTMSYKKI